MAYTDDWENLMNGVFGPGGKLRFDTQKTPPEKPGLPDMNAALIEQQKKLDEMLKKQNAELRRDTTQEALAQSRKMLEDMEADGLLAKGTTEAKQEHLGSFEGLAAEVKKTVLGQDAFVDGVVRAMRRPFVLGTEAPTARNVILLCGAPGTGRHFTLTETARCMAARGLLQSDKLAVMDLALYPNSGAEKLFLQDLYAALHAPGEILAFEHYESCYPGFLKTLADLAVKGSAPLSSRYLVNKEGILVDAGTALAPGAVSRITPCGKYLVFFSQKGREALADKFGAAFVSALGDVCETSAFAREALAALAAQQLNALAAKVKTRLGLTLSAGADVRDYVAAQCSPKQGAAGLSACCDKIFRALSEYCLQTDATLTGTITLTAREDGLDFALNDAGPQKLFDLLPAAYTGAVEEIRKELNDLVGLAPVKEYVFGLADNIQVQQRRAAAGLKTASLSMHMIFTGNPGTGKTTIARLVAKYLKAIGALKGGQLVEVSRGDLVGRYTGHTAPLTNSVIQSALGGVLFIDEAYSLYRGEQDSFGLEAIDTLVKGMEDHRDELVVILAGYTGEMETFLTANSGLASRFPNRIEFPDYTADELLDITNVLQRRAAAGLKTASLSMHMIFTGNPGTGKTTIARLVAKYLKAIGALKGGQLVEVSRGDLVGRYTGHTAPLTNSVIQSALGGVLFIDEAYSLYRGEQDSFGLEAIDTLVKGMEDHRDELVVILAGYTGEMETFLTANSGLASRFPNRIEFPDYTADELLDITNVLARGKGYRLAESCTEPLRGYYERRQAEDARTAGNGRLARNTLEKAIFNQSRRLVAEPAAELDVILPSDLELQ